MSRFIARFVRLSLVAAVATGLAASASAASYYWDTNGTSSGFGSTAGTWGTATSGTNMGSAYWSTSDQGTGATAATVITSVDDVNFGTDAKGLSGNGCKVSLKSNPTFGTMTFGAASGAVTISGGTALPITNTAGNVITVNNALDTISSKLSNVGKLVKAGPGILTLSNGGNAYSGGTDVTAGTLEFQKTGARPTTGTVTVNAGATLAVAAGGASASYDFTSADIDTLLAATNVSFSANSSFGIDTTTATVANGYANATFTYSSAINDSANGALGFTKLGTNNLVLSGANGYTGGTSVSAGVLMFAAANAMPSSGNVSVATGATMAATVGGSGYSSSDVDTLVGKFGSSVTFAANASFGLDTTNGDFSYGSNLADVGGNAVGFTKSGANKLTLSGSNSFTGKLFIQNGTLSVATMNDQGTTGPLGSSGSDTSRTLLGAVGTTGVLEYTGSSNAPTTRVFDVYAGEIKVADANANLTIGNINGTNGGNSTFVKSGPGALTLPWNNSGYTGKITLNEGTLAIQNRGSLGGAPANLQLNGGKLAIQLDSLDTSKYSLNYPAVVGGNAEIVVETQTTGVGITIPMSSLTIGANTLTVSGGNVASGTAELQFPNATTLNGNATFNINKPTAGGVTQLTLSALILNSYTATLTGNGNFAQTGVASGTGGLTLDTAYTGTATLSQANTYAGSTNVNGGTLLVTGSVTGLTTVQSGGVLGGTGAVADVLVNSAGHLSPGNNAPGTLTVGGGLTLQSGAKLDFDLGAAATDLISMSGTTLTLNGQSFSDFNFIPQMDFAEGKYTLIQANAVSGSLGDSVTGPVGSYQGTLAVEGGSLVLNVAAVPEPSTVALLVTALAGVLVWWRKR